MRNEREKYTGRSVKSQERERAREREREREREKKKKLVKRDR